MSNSIYHDVHSDRRGDRRARVQLKAQVSSSGRKFTVEVLDLSTRGMAIRSPEILPSDVLIEVTFMLPQVKEPISSEAKILWSDGRGRAGLQFIDVNRNVGSVVEKWMTRHVVVAQP